MDDPLVWVRRHQHDWRLAAFRMSDLGDLQEDRESKSRLSATVWCKPPEDGERLHACRPNAAPHRVRVSVMKKDNEGIFQRLRRGAREAEPEFEGLCARDLVDDAADPVAQLRAAVGTRRAPATAPA
jgi:hypothetical protein